MGASTWEGLRTASGTPRSLQPQFKFGQAPPALSMVTVVLRVAQKTGGTRPARPLLRHRLIVQRSGTRLPRRDGPRASTRDQHRQQARPTPCNVLRLRRRRRLHGPGPGIPRQAALLRRRPCGLSKWVAAPYLIHGHRSAPTTAARRTNCCPLALSPSAPVYHKLFPPCTTASTGQQHIVPSSSSSDS